MTKRCLHGIDHPDRCCGSCRGTWDWSRRSPSTGKVYASADLIPWFVPPTPAVPTDGGRLDYGTNAAPSDRDWSPLASSSVALVGDVIKLADAPVPRWYRREHRYERQLADLVAAAGMDWYSMLEQHLADLLAGLEDEGEIVTVVAIEAIPSYRDAIGTVDSLRAWRVAARKAA